MPLFSHDDDDDDECDSDFDQDYDMLILVITLYNNDEDSDEHGAQTSLQYYPKVYSGDVNNTLSFICFSTQEL